MAIHYKTLSDAEVAFTNSGSFEAANLAFEEEITECMYRNDATLEEVLAENPQWADPES